MIPSKSINESTRVRKTDDFAILFFPYLNHCREKLNHLKEENIYLN